MRPNFNLHIDRASATPIVEQMRRGIEQAIATGVLVPGARLPSWRDLSAQLGVARGTVRAAYERLNDAQLVVASRSGGTRVADRPSVESTARRIVPESPLVQTYRDFTAGQAIFQMGVPSQDCFPAKLFAQIRTRTVRAELSSLTYPDPCGEAELRREIAAHLAISRSIECLPSQIVVTAGFSGALGLLLHALGLQGRSAWVENPGFPITRSALRMSGMTAIPIPVDGEGMCVEQGLKRAPDAPLAIVTPGQQAPMGPTLSLDRRLALLDWAAQQKAWIVEDDYLGELQLDGRAAPALASLDRSDRVIYVGSFSKTISPTLRLGFIVAPPILAARIAEIATCLVPAPGPAVQLATAEFMREGHYLRHLRRSKRSYAARRDKLQPLLETFDLPVRSAGLAMLLSLPDGVNDVQIVAEAAAFGLSPSPLSRWFDGPAAQPGLLLGVTTAPENRIADAVSRIRRLVEGHLGRGTATS
jgi:GntR family transcriptional regulator/MocR family aminotransferase